MKRWHRVFVPILTICFSLSATVGALAAQAQDAEAARIAEAALRLYVLQSASMPNVQQELKLTDQQLATMADVRSSLSRSSRDPDGRAKVLAEAAKKIESVLSKEQVTRLKQIHLQGLQIRALLLPDVSAKLAITADQQKRLEAIDAKLSSQRKSVSKDLPPEERSAQWRQFVRQALDEANAVLTAAQRAEFEKMRGPAFDFSARVPPA